MPNNTIKFVADNVIGNMHNNGWNPFAFRKYHGVYTRNYGGLWINFLSTIDWTNYDPITQVNLSSPDAGTLAFGGDQRNSHDSQVCLSNLRAVAIYKAAYPTETRFDNANANGYLSLPFLVDHVNTDFKPSTGPTDYSGYNNPKGWVYFALRDCWYYLQGSSLLTTSQKNALRDAALYQAFTYMSDWYDTTVNMFVNAKHQNYQPSQTLLMAAAVIDAAQTWPSLITTGMFYDATPYSTMTPAAWTAAGVACANNIFTRGAWNSTYNIFPGVMNDVYTSGTDTVLNSVVKSDDVSEAAEALVILYNLTGNTTYLNYAQTLLQSIDAKMLDTTYGGYYSSFDTATGVTNKAYKECRATSHMLIAYHYFNLVNPLYMAEEYSILNTLLNDMYQTDGTGGGGYYYRVPGNNFGYYTDNYNYAFSTTLAHAVSIGDTTVQINDLPTLSTTSSSTPVPGPGSYAIVPASYANIKVGTNIQIVDGANTEIVNVDVINLTSISCTFAFAHTGPYTINVVRADTACVIDYQGAQEEEVVLSFQSITGSGPYTVPLNPGTSNGTGQFTKTHTLNATLHSMLYPITLIENSYTTEACANVLVYLLLTVVLSLSPFVPLVTDLMAGVDGIDSAGGVDGKDTFVGVDGIDSYAGSDGIASFAGIE